MVYFFVIKMINIRKNMDLSQFWYYNMVELLCKERINESDFDRIYE